MADQQEWTPERLRALDRAVAEARGWTGLRRFAKYGELIGFDPGETPKEGLECVVPAFSVGCRETFELMEEASINVELSSPVGMAREWWADALHSTRCEKGPTPAIAVCLAYLVAKGRAFNG